MEQPGVTWLGRLPTTFDVWAEMMKSGIFCYPTEFHETCCNTVIEAQMFGAIPIVNPTWAVGDHTLHGVKIYGDPWNDAHSLNWNAPLPWNDRLVQAEYVRAIVEMATNPALQEEIRGSMMKDARGRFTFDRTVDRIERLAPRALRVRQEAAACIS